MKSGRTTVYNELTSEERLDKANEDNKQLEEDFLEYLSATDKSNGTLKQYRANLHIFWCWCVDNNKNKFFVDITKREAIKFQNYTIKEWKWSSRRIKTFIATLRSLENYIIRILDDEFPNYKRVWSEIESPANVAVRTKTVFQAEDLNPLLDKLVAKQEYMKACILALAIYSGKRKAELIRFKASYFTDDNLICDGALYKTPEKMRTKGRGQNGKLLDVYTIAKPFKPYLDLWLKEREKLGITTDWLFPKCKDGKYIDENIEISTMDSMARTFSNMLNKPFYWHSIRHRFVSMLSEQGIPDEVIKDITGWSDVSMVSVYKDIDIEDNFDKYFGAEGIKKVEQKGLSDL